MKFKNIENLIRNEWLVLKKNIKKEFDYLFSLSFKEYIYNLFFPWNKEYIKIIIRLLLFYPVFKFIYDFFFFLFRTLFNFYFIFFERIFEFLKKINVIIFGEGFISVTLKKIINFFRYIILFMFFVNINKVLKKKNIRLWVYIFEKFVDLLYPVFKLIEIFLIFLNIFGCVIASGFDVVLLALLEMAYYHIFLGILLRVRYYITLLKFKFGGPYYLNDVALFHMSSLLKKNGFIAPDCKDKFVWYKAKLSYQVYRRKYLNRELTPDKIDKQALKIYIYLNDLLKDTRYQRKYIGIFDLWKVLYPYSIIVHSFFFLIHFVMGIIYICYIIAMPFVLLWSIYLTFSVAYGIVYYIYCLCFKDIDMYIELKRKEVRNEKIKKRIITVYMFLFNEFKFLFSYVRTIFKKIYEKILW